MTNHADFSLADEIAALEADPDDRAEMLLVTKLMQSLAIAEDEVSPPPE